MISFKILLNISYSHVMVNTPGDNATHAEQNC